MRNNLAVSEKPKSDKVGENSVLRKLYINELRTIYWVEKQMLNLFPRLIRAATTRYLKASFKGHFLATEKHVKRIEEIFVLLNEKRNAKKCQVAAGIISEAKTGIKITQSNTLARDLELLDTAQKFERYETNSYRKLVRFANIFSDHEVELIFKETLTEELEAEEVFIAIEEDTLKDEIFKQEDNTDEEEDDEFEAAEEE